MNISQKSTMVAGLLLISAAVAADAPQAILQTTMLTKVNPQALALWDLTNDAQDESGKLDVKKISPATWAQLIDIGKAIEDGGKTLATTGRVIAAPPGAKLQDEAGPGSSKAADVQRFLDAKPALFRKHALDLQNTGASIVAAVTQRDGKKLGQLADALDQVCEECHVAFWYPQQTPPK
ncbi:MAG: hypothetical protein ABI859_13235 [Pseudomonadota bacterium]